MSQDALRHLLLDILSARRPVEQAALEALSEEDWAEFDALAQAHRLRPLLHWQLTATQPALALPPSLRGGFATAFQQATLRALAVQRGLLRVSRLLDQAGVPSLALKGAYLAFSVYPHAAMRPMRDLDLLVEQDKALAAYARLRAAGFTEVPGIEYSPEACLALDYKHLPPLREPDGLFAVELHTRLTLPGENRMGGADGAGLWARHVRHEMAGQSLGYLSPSDSLLHLVYHAAYDSRFDNGPLILFDIAGLLRANVIDWPLFWAEATAGGWTRGSLLLLAMAQHYFADLAISFDGIAAEELAQARRYAEAAAPMLLRPRLGHDAFFAISLAGKSRWQSVASVVRRAVPSRAMISARFPQARGVRGLAGAYARILAQALTSKLPRILRDGRKASARRERHRAVEMERWLRPG